MRTLGTHYIVTMRPTNIASLLRTATEPMSKRRVFEPKPTPSSHLTYTPPHGCRETLEKLIKGIK